MISVMILSNSFRPDPRVEREAVALVLHGWDVQLICWDRENEGSEYEEKNGIRVHRIKNIISKYGAGIWQILKLPLFWNSAIKSTLLLKPDVIHCHDLDTLYVGIQIKKKVGCPLIFDAHEDYPSLMSLYLPRFMVPVLRLYEKILLRSVDHIFVASTVLSQKYKTRGIKTTTTIGNYQSLGPYLNIQDIDIQKIRTELGYRKQDLVVAYIGGFTRNRLLLPLISAISEVPDVKLLLGGDGHQKKAIELAIENKPNIQYLGWIPAGNIALYMKAADIIYYCLDPNYPGAIYNAPNTLSQAMAAGRPIIANEVGDLGMIVRETNCGLLLKDVNSGSIKDAINKLRDPVFRNELGTNGFHSAVEKYNSDAIERSLFSIYDSLIIAAEQ